MESDAALIARSLAGSEKAFRDIVERHFPMAYSVVRAVLGDHADIEDVVQEVFIKVYRGLSRFRSESKLSTWIYRIARNEAVNAARRPAASGPPLDEVDIRAPFQDSPEEQYRRTEQRHHLGRYLDRLSPDHRVVLELRYMGEKSYEEISELMDMPLGTVKTNIHRAKMELKRIMTKQTVDGKPKRMQKP
jgi:RNA polymerase sigma-70 factor (ECF subfamily)